jgi:hypothetical protein
MRYKGADHPLPEVEAACGCTENGTLHAGLAQGARHFGFSVEAYSELGLEALKGRVNGGDPAIVGYLLQPGDLGSDHFAVAYRITERSICLADSETHLRSGRRRRSVDAFVNDLWLDTDRDSKVVRQWAMFIDRE